MNAPRPSPTGDWLLEVNNLSCGYGGDSVVQDVSFALSHGDIGCLLGPSGCGKSTILRALAGFLPLNGGEICLQSQQISLPGRTLAPEKRRIGMVFQDYALFPHLTIADNVGFGLRGMDKTEKRQKVTELLRAPAGSRRQLPPRTVRRAAAAGGPRPGPGTRADPDPAG